MTGDEPAEVDAERDAGSAGVPGRLRTLTWTAAVLCAAAAAVHLGYAPHHLSEDWAHGWSFVAVGAVQLAAAMLLVSRPRRWVWASIAAVDVAVIAVWIIGRTIGLPAGPEALRTESVGFPDLLCTILEAMVVAIALRALFAPRFVARTPRGRTSGLVTASIVGLVAIVLASVSLTPTFTEAHGSSHDHAAASGATTGETPCELAGPPASPGQVATDAEGHDHRGPSPQVVLSADERTELARQQAEARAAAARYPTVADAEAAGYRMSVAYVPCIGAHYTNPIFAISFDPARPSELLYDGTQPTSKLVGLSYLVWSPSGAPAGFAGGNDLWHQHTSNGGLCQRRGVVIGAEAMSAQECEAIGGRKIALESVWMLHDWVAPGWECSWGVFAGECPELGGRSGGTAWDEPAPDSVASLRAPTN